VIRVRRSRFAAAAVTALALAALGWVRVATRTPPSAADIRPEAIARLDAFIEGELRDKQLPALSVAIVEGDRTVWAKGFGLADPDAKVPASAETVYRVGSVSKLFTDIAIMQLVEQRKLDLDAPIRTVLPDFRPKDPYGPFLTLRELMSHRSGLVREPPVGHYFDPTEPTLAATVESLNSTELVYPPDTRTKYSNAAIAVVGYALERLSGRPFPEAVKRAVLEPAGMTSSAFLPEPAIAGRLAKATMWGYDGRRFPAPTFQLGMAPAGSLYSTVEDLSRFISVLFAGGQGPRGRVLSNETLQAMWTPRFGEKTGYGIGFRVASLDGRKVVGHDGAIYGFATSLAAMPEEKIGAVAVTTLDASNAVTRRIVRAALETMLAIRGGKPLPRLEATEPVPGDLASRLEGTWGTDGGAAAELLRRDGDLSILSASGGEARRLRKRGAGLVTDGPLEFGTEVAVLPDSIRTGDRSLTKIPDALPADLPTRWKDLVGEYGWDHDILYVLERNGKLAVLIEWFEYDPMNEISADAFRFPDSGLYDHETLTFVRDGQGKVTGVRVGPVLFPRRAVGPEDGQTFRIAPVRPVEELRAEALAATPPPQAADLLAPDLVELTSLDPTIRLDVRYATANNFLSAPLYSQARAFLQRPAAEALARAHRRLEAAGYGLLIHDAYRPWYVTKMFWDATPVDKHIFVADPATGSRHNRGCAVDLTLYDRKTGAPLVMTGGYDEMSDRSFAFYPGGTSLQRWQRDLLRRAMEAEGFGVYEWEWWHFDYKDWSRYPVANVRFEEIGAPK
jgi:CubicO group peptidase (beta-lactamase class C family)/D-alanyl-D-alanine dipeptidase